MAIAITADLFGSASASAPASLLTTLYGGASGTSTTTGGDPIAALKLADTNRAKSIARTARQPEVQHDIAAFRSAIAAAKDADTLLKNPTVLKVLLTANGLADQARYPALARRVLMSDSSDSKSLVNRLSDTGWKATVKTFAFATRGLEVLKDPKV